MRAGAPALAVVAGDLLRWNRVLDGVPPREPHWWLVGLGIVAAYAVMCQISAKPVRVEKNAVMNPVGLFLGISIGSYWALPIIAASPSRVA